MADLDRLLRPDVSHAAADAAEPAEFETIERRGVRRRRIRTTVTTAAAAAVAVVLLGGVGGMRIVQPDGPTAPRVVAQPPRSLPTDDGMVEPGTYLVPSSRWSSVDFSITFPEDWFVRDDKLFDTNIEQIDELSIEPFVVTKIYADACQGQRGAQTTVGPDRRRPGRRPARPARP